LDVANKDGLFDTVFGENVSEMRWESDVVEVFGPDVEVVFFDELLDEVCLWNVFDVEADDLVAVVGLPEGVDEHDGEEKEY
jgi:hypothetical protein